MALGKPFRIVIVGGGVAGLALAKMLETFDIDYILLEAHKEIAPAVGSSIGLMPNGLLILDQLGCYESIRTVAHADAHRDQVHRDIDGEYIASTKEFMAQVQQRHGYSLLFFDRQWLLQLLYDSLHHKHRVRLQQRAKKVTLLSDHVEVETTSGDVHHGDILVGADGVHSFIRQEMFRIARDISPGYIAAGEEDRVECFYQCSFGIAENVSKWTGTENCFTAGYGTSFLVATGPGGRVYWFLFVKLQEPKFGSEIPSYTKEDEALFVEKYKTLKITEYLTFGEVYEKRLNSTLTPLHEVVYDKWFFQRIVLIGDSIHKASRPSHIPSYVGMGGNGAIETACAFVNTLLKQLDVKHDSQKGFSTEDIEAVGRQMQAARYQRAQDAMTGAHKRQAILAYENPLLSRWFSRTLVPLLGDEFTFQRFGEPLLGGLRLERLPVPFRPRAIPFDHELPAPPLKPAVHKAPRLVFACVILALLVASFNNAYLQPNVPFSRVSPPPPSQADLPTPVAEQEHRLPWVYVLSQLLSPLLIITIEGYRIGNIFSFINFPIAFTVAIPFLGIGRVATIHALLSILLGFNGITGRYVGREVTRALVPAITITYIIPTILAFTAQTTTNFAQVWVSSWHFAPSLFSILTTAFVFAQSWYKARVGTGTTTPTADEIRASALERYKNPDAPMLQAVYYYAFAVQSTVHISILVKTILEAYTSMSTLGMDQADLSYGNWDALNFLWANEIFKNDFSLAFSVMLIYQLYAIWNLRQQGYVKTNTAISAVTGILAGQILIGPGATWALLWSWRESVLCGLSTLT
ncbi:FAD binding domain protein [Xylariaceae sp. FL1651]|nr:FAD binding domain protein [Xylariaceae sp. FL1651]